MPITCGTSLVKGGTEGLRDTVASANMKHQSPQRLGVPNRQALTKQNAHCNRPPISYNKNDATMITDTVSRRSLCTLFASMMSIQFCFSSGLLVLKK